MYRTLRRPEQELRGDSSVSPERPSRARGRHEHEEPAIEPLLRGRLAGEVVSRRTSSGLTLRWTGPRRRSGVWTRGGSPRAPRRAARPRSGFGTGARQPRRPLWLAQRNPVCRWAPAAELRAPTASTTAVRRGNWQHRPGTSIPDPSIHERWID